MSSVISEISELNTSLANFTSLFLPIHVIMFKASLHFLVIIVGDIMVNTEALCFHASGIILGYTGVFL